MSTPAEHAATVDTALRIFTEPNPWVTPTMLWDHGQVLAAEVRALADRATEQELAVACACVGPQGNDVMCPCERHAYEDGKPWMRTLERAEARATELERTADERRQTILQMAEDFRAEKARAEQLETALRKIADTSLDSMETWREHVLNFQHIARAALDGGTAQDSGLGRDETGGTFTGEAAPTPEEKP